jgi:hypothetical protein
MTNRIKNFDRLKARTVAIPVAIKERMKETVKRSANRGKDLVLKLIPRDTEGLASSVRVEPRGEFSASVVEGNASNPHAAATEFGWNNKGTQMPPQPHFFPANRVAKEQFVKDLRADARKAFKDITGK